MTATLGEELLGQPVERAAREVALALLAAAEGARARLGTPGDAEALHDFRVTLRRLRSWLRAFRAPLDGSVRGKDRRQLRDIARATGTSRDLEVHLAWLRAQRPRLAARQRHGLDWLLARLETRRRAADAELFDEVARDFAGARDALARSLERYTVVVHLRRPDAPRPMAAEVASLLRAHAATLRAALAPVREMADEAEAHRARIAGKRLRYLLEPLREALPDADTLVERLKALQDALGDLHDAHVFGRELATAIEEAAAEEARAEAASLLDGGGAGQGTRRRRPPRDPRPGLVAVAGLLRERSEGAWRETSAEWLGGAADPFLARVEALADALEARAAPAIEIERKYLLRALPPETAEAPAREIAQGYLPGARLAERVRRVRADGAERWYRTVKLGTGMAKVEIEEETTPRIGEALWRLTSGRRVRKTRFDIPDGALTWEIDRFDDRDLVLAEVELPAPDTPVTPPAWLEPYIVREVTGEGAYSNINLAR